MKTLWLSGLLASGLELVAPVHVTITHDDDGEVLVADDFSTVYGNAKSEAAAIEDYGSSLREHGTVLALRCTAAGCKKEGRANRHWLAPVNDC